MEICKKEKIIICKTGMNILPKSCGECDFAYFYHDDNNSILCITLDKEIEDTAEMLSDCPLFEEENNSNI